MKRKTKSGEKMISYTFKYEIHIHVILGQTIDIENHIFLFSSQEKYIFMKRTVTILMLFVYLNYISQKCYTENALEFSFVDIFGTGI